MAKTLITDFRLDPLRNLVINGNFDFWQRGTNFAAIAHNTTHVDRFRYFTDNTSAVHTVSRSTVVPNIDSEYSLLHNCTTADAAMTGGKLVRLRHSIEGYFFRTVRGKKFTLSFWVRAHKTGISCVSFKNHNATRCYISEYEIFQSDVWEKKTITIEHDETGSWDYGSGVGLRIEWALMAGPDFQSTPNTWLDVNRMATSNQVNHCDTVGNFFRIAQVQFNAGTEEVPFSLAGGDYAGELELCQRYYEIGNNRHFNWSTTQTIGITTRFVTRKRATPTIGQSSGLVGTTEGIGPDYFASYASIGGGLWHSFGWTADAELA